MFHFYLEMGKYIHMYVLIHIRGSKSFSSLTPLWNFKVLNQLPNIHFMKITLTLNKPLIVWWTTTPTPWIVLSALGGWYRPLWGILICKAIINFCFVLGYFLCDSCAFCDFGTHLFWYCGKEKWRWTGCPACYFLPKLATKAFFSNLLSSKCFAPHSYLCQRPRWPIILAAVVLIHHINQSNWRKAGDCSDWYWRTTQDSLCTPSTERKLRRL